MDLALPWSPPDLETNKKLLYKALIRPFKGPFVLKSPLVTLG